MAFQEYKFEDLPNIMAENNRLLSAVKVLLETSSAPKQTPSDVLNIQQASELLSLTIPTLYSKVSRREIPHFKRGKKLYFSRAELTAFVSGGKRPTTEEVRTQAIQDTALAMQKGNRAQ